MTMPFANFWEWLENLPIAMAIGESWWFPLLESIHVVTITMVVGSLLMTDLRLIGVAARRYTVKAMSKELLPWTWVAFVLSVVTGAGLFITRAGHYANNIAFQAKFALLLLAGINMAIFHFGVYRSVSNWDAAPRTPAAAKFAGVVSLVLWTGVLLAGRWVGHLN